VLFVLLDEPGDVAAGDLDAHTGARAVSSHPGRFCNTPITGSLRLSCTMGNEAPSSTERMAVKKFRISGCTDYPLLPVVVQNQQVLAVRAFEQGLLELHPAIRCSSVPKSRPQRGQVKMVPVWKSSFTLKCSSDAPYRVLDHYP